MGDASIGVKGQGDVAATQAANELGGATGVPAAGTFDDPMAGVRAQRSRAAAQIAQTMRAWGGTGARVFRKAEPGQEDPADAEAGPAEAEPAAEEEARGEAEPAEAAEKESPPVSRKVYRTPKNEHGGGKNAAHANLKRRQEAEKKYQDWKKKFEELNAKPNKTPADKQERDKAETQMKHWKGKMDETGDQDSQAEKR